MLEKFFITCNAENHWTLDATHADDKIIFLRDEYEKFWRKILRGENFALTRYADGEHNLMLGYKMNNIDGWTSSGQTALARHCSIRSTSTRRITITEFPARVAIRRRIIGICAT